MKIGMSGLVDDTCMEAQHWLYLMAIPIESWSDQQAQQVQTATQVVKRGYRHRKNFEAVRIDLKFHTSRALSNPTKLKSSLRILVIQSAAATPQLALAEETWMVRSPSDGHGHLRKSIGAFADLYRTVAHRTFQARRCRPFHRGNWRRVGLDSYHTKHVEAASHAVLDPENLYAFVAFLKLLGEAFPFMTCASRAWSRPNIHELDGQGTSFVSELRSLKLVVTPGNISN